MRIKNGGIYRDIDERYFQKYKNNGWERVEKPKKEEPKKEEKTIEISEDILGDIEAPQPKTKKKG